MADTPIVDPGATSQSDLQPDPPKPAEAPAGAPQMAEVDEALVRIVMGKRGCGKTTKARNLVSRCRHPGRVLYLDTLQHDYADGVTFYDLAELRAYWLKVYRGNFSLIYRPGDPEEEFPTLCQMVYACGRMVFVVEELDLYFKPGGSCCQELTTLVMRGRHADVDLIGVTQRPRGFGRSFTAMAKEFCIFQTQEPDDLDYFAARLGKQVKDVLPTLPLYHFLHVQDFGGPTRCAVCKDDLGGRG